jgi:pimeloyl-[acyl-carrier protein] methyl ester esterase
VAKDMDQLAPLSCRQIFAAASHAPFISHPEEFVQTLKDFIK